jgi:hypothetical protein
MYCNNKKNVCKHKLQQKIFYFFLLLFTGNTTVPLVDQDLGTLPVHISSTPVLMEFVLLNLCFKFDTTGATSGAGTATLLEHMSSTPVCSGVLVAESLAFCV